MKLTKALIFAGWAASLLAGCTNKPEFVRESNKDAGRKPNIDASVTTPDGGPPIFVGDGSPCTGSACGKDSGTDGGDAGPPSYCGDGKLDPGTESCDDGNVLAGDGCSAACDREADYVCPTAGQPCVSTVVCGDGKIGGTEQCDDRNAQKGDGCDDKCQLETGWACPYVGLTCVAAKCGDSIIAGVEECDDGNAVAKDGCDATCRLEDGFKCDVPGTQCTTTTCGDKKAEGTEQCDDGNFDLGDGCTPFCKLEPKCDQGPCVSACGDGILLGNEQCDDGNQRDGDGCSATCTVETGYSCTQPPLPTQLDIPLVVRDMNGLNPLPAVNPGPPPDYAASNHVDFQLVGSEPFATEDGVGGAARIVRAGAGSSPTGRGLDLGQPGETQPIHHLDGSTIATVSLSGKPVYGQTRAQCDLTVLPANPTWTKCTKTTMDLDSFASWYVDHDSAGNAITFPNFLGRNKTVLKTLTLLRGAFDQTTGAFTAGGDAYTFDSRFMKIDGTQAPSDGFFPVDELGTTGKECNGALHNFHFTSEVRFWFEYDATTTPSLNFSGDDDVWVYVNGHLALDIGGIHGRIAKSFTVDAANATAWGLSDKKVFEIAVFQAERNQCASNYWLTLKGFNSSKTVCKSTCGDGIIANDEVCDDGAQNQVTDPPDYGKCSADCKKRGPNCGDGHVDVGHEACDDGVNTSVYDVGGKGCAPGCVKPPSCGDGKIQSPPEQCDDGTNDGAYGGCTPACKLAARCGDGITQRAAGEGCDDGPRGSVTCTPGCRPQSPR